MEQLVNQQDDVGKNVRVFRLGFFAIPPSQSIVTLCISSVVGYRSMTWKGPAGI